MIEYTDQEKKFMEKIGFTPGPWVFNMSLVGAMHEPFLSCDRQKYDGMRIFNGKTKNERIANAKLIAQSPNMFLCLFHTTRKNVETGCIKCAHNFPEKDCDECPKTRQVKVMEYAINKTWEELCQIWEECK